MVWGSCSGAYCRQYPCHRLVREEINGVVKFVKGSPKVGEFMRQLAAEEGVELRAFTPFKTMKFLSHSLHQLMNFIHNREVVVKGLAVITTWKGARGKEAVGHLKAMQSVEFDSTVIFLTGLVGLLSPLSKRSERFTAKHHRLTLDPPVISLNLWRV